jgi:hypothetical protein
MVLDTVVSEGRWLPVDEIRPGVAVVARDAEGENLRRRALTGVMDGHDFPVVWVCREEEWQQAEQERRKPEGVPWPADDVSIVSEVRASQ